MLFQKEKKVAFSNKIKLENDNLSTFDEINGIDKYFLKNDDDDTNMQYYYNMIGSFVCVADVYRCFPYCYKVKGIWKGIITDYCDEESKFKEKYTN